MLIMYPIRNNPVVRLHCNSVMWRWKEKGCSFMYMYPAHLVQSHSGFGLIWWLFHWCDKINSKVEIHSSTKTSLNRYYWYWYYLTQSTAICNKAFFHSALMKIEKYSERCRRARTKEKKYHSLIKSWVIQKSYKPYQSNYMNQAGETMESPSWVEETEVVNFQISTPIHSPYSKISLHFTGSSTVFFRVASCR